MKEIYNKNKIVFKVFAKKLIYLLSPCKKLKKIIFSICLEHLNKSLSRIVEFFYKLKNKNKL